MYMMVECCFLPCLDVDSCSSRGTCAVALDCCSFLGTLRFGAFLTAVGSPDMRDENSHGPPSPSRMLNTLLPIAFAIAI